jgi:hypothetical protein
LPFARSAAIVSKGGNDSLSRRNTMAKGRRTTHRSASGKKLYAVRDAKGRFKDIQSYARSSRADQKRKSKAEKRGK